MTREELNLQKVQIAKEILLALISKGHIGLPLIEQTFDKLYTQVDNLTKRD